MNVPMNNVSTSVCRPVSFGTSSTSFCASAASVTDTPTIDFSGCWRMRRAYQITYAIAAATSTIQSAIRRPMPVPMLTPAASDATPVENGLTVEPMMPAPEPRKMIDAATSRS